eukprot:gene6415-4094_t
MRAGCLGIQRIPGGGYTLVDARKRAHRGKCAAGRRCTSFRAELCALIKCLDDLIAGRDDAGEEVHFPNGKCVIRIALDSQSAIVALAKGASAQQGVLEMRAWERLTRVCATRRARVIVQYVPGHVDIDEQEQADDIAKEAARETAQEGTTASLSLAKAAIRAELRQRLIDRLPKDHLWLRATGGVAPNHKDLPRGLQRTMSQLRAGRSTLTQDIMYRFGANTKKELDLPANGAHGIALAADGTVRAVADHSAAAKAKIAAGWILRRVEKTAVHNGAEGETALAARKGVRTKIYFDKHRDSTCPACGEADDGTEHLILRCPAFALARNAVFASFEPPPTMLRTDPGKVMEFLER